MATGTRNFVKNLKKGVAKAPLMQRPTKRLKTHDLQQRSKATGARSKDQNDQSITHKSVANLQVQLDQSRDEQLREKRRRIEAEELLENNRKIIGSIQKNYNKVREQLEKAKEHLEGKEKQITNLKRLLIAERKGRKQEALKYKQTAKMFSKKLKCGRKRNVVESGSEYGTEDSDADQVNPEASRFDYPERKSNEVDDEGEESEGDLSESLEGVDCQSDEETDTSQNEAEGCMGFQNSGFESSKGNAATTAKNMQELLATVEGTCTSVKGMENTTISTAEEPRASRANSSGIGMENTKDTTSEEQRIDSTREETKGADNLGSEVPEAGSSRMEMGSDKESRNEDQSVHSTQTDDVEGQNHFGMKTPETGSSVKEVGGSKESSIEGQEVFLIRKETEGPNHSGADAPKAGSSGMQMTAVKDSAAKGSTTDSSRIVKIGDMKCEREEEDDDDDFQPPSRKPNQINKARQATKAEPKKRKCNICGEFFKIDNFYRHRDSHNNKEGYACRTCGKVYTRPDNLKRHEIIHKNN